MNLQCMSQNITLLCGKSNTSQIQKEASQIQKQEPKYHSPLFDKPFGKSNTERSKSNTETGAKISLSSI